MSKRVKLPLGTKRAIADAFYIAIGVLEGVHLSDLRTSTAYPKTLRKLRKAHRLLLECEAIYQ